MNIFLQLIDSSYKVNEVTGKDMGGDYVYNIPVSNLRVGEMVCWPQNRIPDHSVNILEIGEDYVTVDVRCVSGRRNSSVRLHPGEEIRESYMFGEWSYGYKLSLIKR